jgi:hypothetical protein
MRARESFLRMSVYLSACTVLKTWLLLSRTQIALQQHAELLS